MRVDSNLSLKIFVGLVTIISVDNSIPVFAEDLLESGKKFYAEGKIQEAKKCFLETLKREPKSATAHYLLGNVLIRQNNSQQALAEYESSVALDKYGLAGHYSQLALSELHRAKASDASLMLECHNRIVEDSSSEVSATKSTKITEEQNKSLLLDLEKAKKIIVEDGDRREKKIEDEVNFRIAEIGPPAYGRRLGQSFLIFDPEPEIKSVRLEYAPQIEAIKVETRKKLDEVLTSFKVKKSALAESAAWIGKDQRTLKSPLSNNKYLHNYESSDEVSGYLVPVKAAPAKRLGQILGPLKE